MEPSPGSPAGVERPCFPIPAARPRAKIPNADAAAPASATRLRNPRRVTPFPLLSVCAAIVPSCSCVELTGSLL